MTNWEKIVCNGMSVSFMRKIIILILVVCCGLSAQSKKYYQYDNTVTFKKNQQSGYNWFELLVPCPQSNEYQDVYVLKLVPDEKKWKQREIKTNRNRYLDFYIDSDDLNNDSLTFHVGYRCIMSPKSVDVDFNSLKRPDGNWKQMPEYDTSSPEYKENTGRSGDIIVPDNDTIQEISNKLFKECSNNKLAYAEACYEYVAANYKYKNPYTGLHPVSEILRTGGGDCGSFSTVYISLLRARGIPARHVFAIGGDIDGRKNHHIWAEFYIQDFGWIPVDVTYRNSNPWEDYFGKYRNKWLVVQKGAAMKYPITAGEIKKVNAMQTYVYWYRYKKSPVKVKADQKIEMSAVAKLKK